MLAAIFCGALGGALFAPQPAGAVSKEMIELQQQVTQILQAQQDLRSAVDGNSAATPNARAAVARFGQPAER